MGKKRQEEEAAVTEEQQENVAQEPESEGAGCGTCDEAADCADKTTEAPAAEKSKSAAPKIPKESVRTVYKLVTEREKKEGEKALPKQAAQIVDIIAAAGEEGIERATLLEAMKPVIETRQPIERILGFYQPRLLEENYISVIK